MDRFFCHKCDHNWDQETKVTLPAPINVVVEEWSSITCPQCAAGWRHLSIKLKKDDNDVTD